MTLSKEKLSGGFYAPGRHLKKAQAQLVWGIVLCFAELCRGPSISAGFSSSANGGFFSFAEYLPPALGILIGKKRCSWLLFLISNGDIDEAGVRHIAGSWERVLLVRSIQTGGWRLSMICRRFLLLP